MRPRPYVLLLLLGCCSSLLGSSCSRRPVVVVTGTRPGPGDPETSDIPSRIGVLPVIDARPTIERHPPVLPRTALFVAGIWGSHMRGKGGRFSRLPSFEKLWPDALDIIRKTGAFQKVVLLPLQRWRMRDLPHIARKSGFRYLMVIEVRHLFALHYENEAITVLNSQIPSTVPRNSDSETTSSFESTVMRFRLYEVRGDVVRVFWQMSARGVVRSINSLRYLSAEPATIDCFKQLAEGLVELRQHLSSERDRRPMRRIGSR